MRRRAFLAMTTTASGGIVVFAIAWLATRRLTPVELGFFFSFLSFGSMAQLGDFGLYYAALQSAAHLAGTGRLAELPGLARRIGAWNFRATLSVTSISCLAGWLTFRSNHNPSDVVQWTLPWLAYSVATFLAHLTIPRISLREGSGKVEQMWRLRLAQEWIAGLSCLAVLYAGGKLWSLAVFAAMRAVVGGAWLMFGDPIRVTRDTPPFSEDRWKSDVWPFQWKMGLSGISGYLVFRAFSPILFLTKGAVAAGAFGLAIAMMNLLVAISTAWPMSQAARYGAMNAAGRFQDLRRDFPALLWSSTAVAMLGASTLSILLWEARRIGLTFATRLPEHITTLIILATAIPHHVVACYAMFLRSEGREPFLVFGLVGSVITVIAVAVTASFYDLRAVAIVMMCCVALGVPVAIAIFRRRVARIAA
jgi:hypothetical protein